MRDQLPEECKRELDYRALLETLAVLDGEYVCLSVENVSGPGGRGARVGVSGRLRRFEYSWADGFAIGDGGRMLLYEADLVRASLQTFDGNDFFRILIRLGEVTFLLGDESLRGDEFEM